MENNKSIEKWKIVVISIAMVVISIVIGVIIGKSTSKESFIAFEYDGSTTCYSLKSGQVNASTSSVSNGEGESKPMDKLLNIDLNGIHNNKDAIKAIEQQVTDNGGRIISVLQ